MADGGLRGEAAGTADLPAKQFERTELDAMLRQARTPKVRDWLVDHVVEESPHAEDLRPAWSADPDPVVASAGWELTTGRVAEKPEGLDLPALLDRIEAEMEDAPGCTSPYAPIWITEMVSRQRGG
ncbi:hypothetical protein [Geodermatophilus sp. SYSU D01105]